MSTLGASLTESGPSAGLSSRDPLNPYPCKEFSTSEGVGA